MLVSHQTAREIASSPPLDTAGFHKFLNTHFGPDPRPNLTTDLNRVLNPDGHS